MSRQRRRLRPGRVLRIAALAGLVTTLLVTPLTEAAAAPTALRTAIVVLDYPDAAYGLTQAKRTFLENIHYGNTPDGLPGLAAYTEEVSDGRFTFVPMPGRPTVIGPLKVNAERSCNAYTLRQHTLDALAAVGVPQNAYDALSVHLKPPGCNWGGVGWTQNGVKTTIYGPVGAQGTVLRHEFGHAFGLNHLGSTTCTATLANCTGAGYRGSTPMGGQGDSGYAAPELRKKGWFRDNQLVVSPAPGTYTLKPLHAPRATAGTRSLEIPRTHGTWNRLFVAYRATGTVDPRTPHGVELHLSKPWTAGGVAYATFQLVDPLPNTAGTFLAPGNSITDPASGLTITTVSADASGAVVRITAA